MKVLQLSAHFPPNVGGVETHLSDLVKALVKRNWEVFVLTYRPLTTDAKWNIHEKDDRVEIFRIPWLPNLFYNLLTYPLLEFVYLLPGLFFTAPFVILFKNPEVVHAHGLVAGFVGVFWGKLFGRRVIISTHSIYHFPEKSFYRELVKWIFKSCDKVMGLSKQAEKEIISLGISGKKADDFIYWIDLNKFQISNSKLQIKKKLVWENKFTVLFVGRLIEEKGVLVLLESVQSWNNDINLKIIGSGPMEENIKNKILNTKNVKFLGKVDNDQLALYYCAADVLIVPSVHEEGFGRVILESLACGTPVIGSRRGAIPEAMDATVGKLIDPTPQNIKNAVEYFFKNQNVLKKLSKNCRKFAERRYSEKNVNKIIKSYTK